MASHFGLGDQPDVAGAGGAVKDNALGLGRVGKGSRGHPVPASGIAADLDCVACDTTIDLVLARQILHAQERLLLTQVDRQRVRRIRLALAPLGVPERLRVTVEGIGDISLARLTAIGTHAPTRAAQARHRDDLRERYTHGIAGG